MAKFKFVLLITLVMALLGSVNAGTYTLTDGQTITGDPVSFDANGVVFRLSSGSFSPRTAWGKFTQESLKELQTEARNPQEAEFITPFLEETAAKEAEQKQITVKEPQRVERPTGKVGLGALFSSSLGLFLLFVLYAANIYAAYEIALFKNMQPLLVCGIAAVAPFIGPIIFLCLPAKLDYVDAMAAQQFVEEAAPAEQHVEEQTEQHYATEEVGQEQQPTTQFELPQEPVSAPAPAQPSVTFQKGQFIFNRRFFETKMPAFFRPVPDEANKDMVLVVKAVRGEYVARRIPKATQTELHLEIFKGQVTAEEVVPFNEILEVSIRHKDSV